ncbi:VOC family protein [Candidatus Gottesmanbacteria bacterium]|nr:VOC family protein [Candidatus Gottesmanbacteria bacterium]
MIKAIEGILIGTENAKRLAKFYREVVGFKQVGEYVMGDDANLYDFAIKDGPGLYILDHSEVKGKNKMPGRLIINFEVDNIEKEVKRLKKSKVKLVKDIYHVEDYGYIATFEDPDGNYFQFVKTRQ